MTLASICFANVVKSVISARHSMDAEQEAPFDNPYVTEGLIGMWDGEWNSANGVHRGRINVWHDLTENGQDIPIDMNHAIMHSNCIEFDGKGRGATINSPLALSDMLTIEVVAQREKAYVNATTRPFFCYSQNVYWRGNGTEQGGPIGYNLYVDNDRYSSYIHMYCCPNVETVNNPVALSYSAIDPTFYSAPTYYPLINGVLSSRIRVYGYSSPRSSGIFAGTTSNADGATRIYCVRVYDRVLTEEEKQHNYAVDAERFGL